MNDELTPSERAALRSRILGGARDIKPVGAHRNAWIAGSVAAVLVAAIAGGVTATSLLSAAPVAETPSPSVSTATPEPVTTPTPTPTPTQTSAPTPAASAGRAPFEDSCENVLTSDQLTSVTGHEMSDVTIIPHDSRFTLVGGISCRWASSDEYRAAEIVVAVLPSAQRLPMPEADWFDGDECPSDRPFCTYSWSDDAVQIHVSIDAAGARAEQRAETAASIAGMIRVRYGDYPAGVPATSADAWWSPWNCADLSASIDPRAFGYDSATVEASDPGYPVADNTCSVTLTRPDGTLEATATIVPGGAVGLDAMAASAYTHESVTVAGASAAYWVEIQLKDDGGGGRDLWATDGTNLLTVSGFAPPGDLSIDSTPDFPILLAEQLLPTL